jgi:hypothetical protein
MSVRVRRSNYDERYVQILSVFTNRERDLCNSIPLVPVYISVTSIFLNYDTIFCSIIVDEIRSLYFFHRHPSLSLPAGGHHTMTVITLSPSPY